MHSNLLRAMHWALPAQVRILLMSIFFCPSNPIPIPSLNVLGNLSFCPIYASLLPPRLPRPAQAWHLRFARFAAKPTQLPPIACTASSIHNHSYAVANDTSQLEINCIPINLHSPASSGPRFHKTTPETKMSSATRNTHILSCLSLAFCSLKKRGLYAKTRPNQGAAKRLAVKKRHKKGPPSMQMHRL